jgi:Sulfotransferase domain
MDAEPSPPEERVTLEDGRGSAPRVPDFFIVGHPKSGTTALYQMLERHPQLHMPVKEPRFFAPELRSRFLDSRFSRLLPSKLPSTLDSYLSLFAGARPEQLIGEASPSYLRSELAAQRIAEVAPEAKIVALFREPASFLRSFHLQSVHNHVETQKDFAKAIALEDSRRHGKQIPLLSQTPQTLLYSEHIRYAEQLRRYHAHFSPENVLVLIYDDFRSDNEATVREVQRFLGVEDTLPIGPTSTETLPGIRSLTLHQLKRAVFLARRRRGRAARRAPANGGALQAAWRRVVYTDPPAPDEQLMLELRRRFKPEVVALSEYLDRDLVTLWGYEQLG